MTEEELIRADEEAELWLRETLSEFEDNWSPKELPPIVIEAEGEA